MWKSIPSTCQAVYTDNPKVDESFIKEAFQTAYKDDIPLISVLLDIFHAQNRVIKELFITHPDLKFAKSSLKQIFSKIPKSDGFNSPQDLKEAFMEWEQQLKAVHGSVALENNDKIRYLGKSIPNS